MSSTISSARHPLLESNNTEGKDLFVLRVPSEPPDVWSCCRPFIHPTIANTKQTFSSFSFLTLLPSLSSSSSFCFFLFFPSPRCCYERPPGVREWIKHQRVGRKGTASPERIECRALFERRAAVEVTEEASLSTRTPNHQGTTLTSNISLPSWIVIFPSPSK